MSLLERIKTFISTQDTITPSSVRKVDDFRPRTLPELEKREQTEAHVKEVQAAEGIRTIEATRILNRVANRVANQKPPKYKSLYPLPTPAEVPYVQPLRPGIGGVLTPVPSSAEFRGSPEMIMHVASGRILHHATLETGDPCAWYRGLSPQETLTRYIERAEVLGMNRAAISQIFLRSGF